MVKGKTSSGFEFEIDEALADDFEFLEYYAAWEQDGRGIFPLLTFVLGESQKKAFYAHLKKETGRVPKDRAVIEFREILTALSEDPQTKN